MRHTLKYMALALLIGSGYEVQAQSKRKPNIIFILADDLGYGNVKSFNPNSKIPTPNLDRLAGEGIKFTRFYSGNTVCAPSRCALMTGFNMGHAWVRGNAKAKDGLAALRAQDTTLAQRLKGNGYRTGMFGKWGLGDDDSQGAPHLKGFDAFYGYLDQSHAHDYYTNHLYEIIGGKTVEVPVDTAQYTEDLIVNKAVDFINANKDQPFFLYLPLTVPHAELKVPAALLKKFQHADGSSKFPPETPFEKKGNYDSQAQPHATFAAMVNKLDADVGTLVALIKKLGLDNDTYIFFTSDNGPHKEGGADPVYFNSGGVFRGVKRDLYEGGIRVPLIVRAPGKIAAAQVNPSPWAFWDILPTLGELTGTATPKNIDGLSFLPLLNGKKAVKEHDYFYWQFNENGLKEALTKGDWKLIRFKDKGTAEKLELYNLKSDISEKHDIAAKNPDTVKALYALMKKAKTPAENPRFDWSEIEQ
ncbi:sulfatase [Pedobacter kyungheensis]|uniref:Sulfatase n=1 Tax=Pedobacter kyungheensis TaxID=1069985 RepID=A0A0C1FH59_9SPHI|nr:arylsulfatase [Pedobacter kyungheensis]KIA92337.1 sulfatase [Pedobacter kyungheensis]